MSISTVTVDDLRRMNGKEGLVLQGCGDDPQEWLDGINDLLTDEGILKNGSKFENISVFQNGSLTNILVVLRRFQKRISVACINGYVVFFVFHLHPSEIAQGLLYRQRGVFSRVFFRQGATAPIR